MISILEAQRNAWYEFFRLYDDGSGNFVSYYQKKALIKLIESTFGSKASEAINGCFVGSKSNHKKQCLYKTKYKIKEGVSLMDAFFDSTKVI